MSPAYYETTVGGRLIEQAQTIRRFRDKHAENAFPAEEPDLRWVGDLGELVFAKWLKAQGIPFTMNGGIDTLPDFVVGTKTLALKTRPNRPDALCAKRHAERDVEMLVFASYATMQRRWKLLGAIPPAELRSTAELRPAKTADGKPYFLLPAAQLYPPSILLSALRREMSTGRLAA